MSKPAKFKAEEFAQVFGVRGSSRSDVSMESLVSKGVINSYPFHIYADSAEGVSFDEPLIFQIPEQELPLKAFIVEVKLESFKSMLAKPFVADISKFQSGSRTEPWRAISAHQTRHTFLGPVQDSEASSDALLVIPTITPVPETISGPRLTDKEEWMQIIQMIDAFPKPSVFTSPEHSRFVWPHTDGCNLLQFSKITPGAVPELEKLQKFLMSEEAQSMLLILVNYQMHHDPQLAEMVSISQGRKPPTPQMSAQAAMAKAQTTVHTILQSHLSSQAGDMVISNHFKDVLIMRFTRAQSLSELLYNSGDKLAFIVRPAKPKVTLSGNTMRQRLEGKLVITMLSATF